MVENIDNNKIIESNHNAETFEFKYDFVNMPWDDRTKESKFGIVALLIALFVLIMAGVINNFVMHYRDYGSSTNMSNEVNCYRVKADDNPFVARIYSMSSKELLCVGAVVSATSVLANGVCVKAGPIRVLLGSPLIPNCKKGFTVDVIETVYHDGIISKKLALLSSYEDIRKCSSSIRIGHDIDWSSRANIIGRPLHLGRSLSRQHVTLIKPIDLPQGFNFKAMKINNTICVKDLSRCPVRAGDLLVQNGFLYGIASTTMHNRISGSKLACFADLKMAWKSLKELDNDIR